jgi:hypothetical protein
MSTKFEKLLDYLINEEHDKADELFHEIVVEKSRQIYENLIAEEDDEDKEMDESEDDQDESVDEAKDDEDESVDENMELEDSYGFEDEDKKDGFDPEDDDDATGTLGQEIGMDRSEEDPEEQEDSAMMGIKDAIAELEAAFAQLEKAQGGEEDAMGMGGFGDEDDEEDDDEMAMGKPAFEGRRVTREYVEKVGNDWEKNSQKTQGQYVGANTGESFPAPTEGKSAINTNADRTKPTSGANAKNLAQGGDEGQKNTGTTPNKVNKGITPEKSEQFTGKDWETNSKPGGNAGVKNLKKVAQNSSNPGPVGSGTGGKAGQTSVSSDKPFLKKL